MVLCKGAAPGAQCDQKELGKTCWPSDNRENTETYCDDSGCDPGLVHVWNYAKEQWDCGKGVCAYIWIFMVSRCVFCAPPVLFQHFNQDGDNRVLATSVSASVDMTLKPYPLTSDRTQLSLESDRKESTGSSTKSGGP